jgi:hypothetical protein
MVDMPSREELLADYEIVARNKVMWERLLESRRKQLAAEGISPEDLTAIEESMAREVRPLDDRHGYGLTDPTP